MKNLFKILSVLMFLTAFSVQESFGQEIVEQEFYDNGKLKTSIYKVRNELNVLKYYEDGSLKEKSIFKDNSRNGKFHAWHENGMVSMEVQYADNTPVGDWTIWNESGEIIASARFHSGKVESGSMWNENGSLIAFK